MQAPTTGDSIQRTSDVEPDSEDDSRYSIAVETSDKSEYLAVFESLLTPAILLDSEGHIWALNHEALKLVRGTPAPGVAGCDEHAPEQLAGYGLRGQTLDSSFPWLPSAAQLLADDASGQRFECALEEGQGLHYFEGRVSRLSGPGEKLLGSVIILNDVSEHRALVERLDRLARTDSLTEINNRRRFREIAQQEILRAWRYSRHLSVLAIDVDHFKEVNDTYGHATGDELLVALARTMSVTMRASDTLARMGGEEFAILLPETDDEAAIAAAGRIITRVGQLVVHTANGPLCTTVSVGVATLTATDRSLDDLLNRADTALYRAKALGRNCAVAAPMGRSALDASSGARIGINAAAPASGASSLSSVRRGARRHGV